MLLIKQRPWGGEGVLLFPSLEYPTPFLASSVAPHYLAGLREVPAEAPTYPPGRGFFVASSSVGVSRLSGLSSGNVRQRNGVPLLVRHGHGAVGLALAGVVRGRTLAKLGGIVAEDCRSIVDGGSDTRVVWSCASETRELPRSIVLGAEEHARLLRLAVFGTLSWTVKTALKGESVSR